MLILEDVLELPAELVEKWTGLSLDIGGSGAKLAYRSKEDYKNGKPLFQDKPATGRVKLALCAQDQTDDVIEFALKNCDIASQTEDVPTLMCTGLGSQLYKVKLQKALNVTIEIDAEMDCISRGASHLLDTQPEEKCFRELSQEALRDAKTEADVLRKSIDAGKEHSESENIDTSKDLVIEKDGKLELNMALEDTATVYPFILVILGSNTAYLQVNADGTFRIIEGTFYGARAFHGLGSLTTGAQTFEELIELVEKGDNTGIDTTTGDMKAAEAGGDNIYAKAIDGLMVYAFGKAVNKNKDIFRREDIAASLVNSHCIQLVQAIHLSTLAYKIPRVFIAGNFVTPAIIRKYLTKQIVQRLSWQQDKPPVKIRFLVAGGHLGAIGAFLKSVNVKKTSAQDTAL